MYKIPARTLFLGKRLIYMPECHSTNDIAAQILDQPSTHEGTVVITDHQLRGRGQRGNTWVTAKHQNLTFSIVLQPSFLAPQDQFYLNVVVSLGVHNLLQELLREPVYVKWPNDVIVEKGKIAGILIENQLQGFRLAHCIAGVGVNVNQRDFPVPNAASISGITGRDHSLPDVLELLLSRIEDKYLRLREGKRNSLRDEYLGVMYWKDEVRSFSSGGQRFEGRITGIDEHGQLCVWVDGSTRRFGVKEIQFER